MPKVEEALNVFGIHWFAADLKEKLDRGYFAINALQKLMPDYDLSRNLGDLDAHLEHDPLDAASSAARVLLPCS
jgi:hypothetical protein